LLDFFNLELRCTEPLENIRDTRRFGKRKFRGWSQFKAALTKYEMMHRFKM